jgi:uncharacterized protein YdcH (DUF465 family)
MSKLSVTDVQEQLTRLKSEHARLEMRLQELERHLSLTPDEQLERAQIKKAKLQLKDDILRWTHQQRLLS